MVKKDNMETNFLSGFPPYAELSANEPVEPGSYVFEANCHIHTPYSFSAFDDLDTVFRMAKEERIDALGINDFYVSDGYESFHKGCISNNIFPLFNIEFIGLLKEEQSKGIRINDPNNPGRIYFCGKGLDFPFHLSDKNLRLLSGVKVESQCQLRAMVSKLNRLIAEGGSKLSLDFDQIRKRFAKELVRERHIAKAVRYLASENFSKDEDRMSFIESLYGGKRSKQSFADAAALENEIRSNILKAGGTAFVEEDERSFLPLGAIKEIILDAGGIPCYPVLLDDPSGKFTEFEGSFEKLYDSLTSMGVGCIELIPGRNALNILSDFVSFFDSRDFIVTFGTEHNTPEMIPLTVTARGGTDLTWKLEEVNRRGVCVIAAHQYFHAQKMEGYTDAAGKPRKNMKKEFEAAGQAVIEFYLRDKQI